MALITPDIIEAHCIDVLVRGHAYHLAALERDLELEPRTIEPLRTVDVLVGEGVRLREDTPPVVLLGAFGTSRTPEKDPNWHLTLTWVLACQIVVLGQDRVDTIRRRGWYAMTVAECLCQRVARQAEPIDSVSLVDIDFTNGQTAERQSRTVGEAQLMFDVRVRESLNLRRPPGEPLLDPYEPPAGWGPVHDATTTTDKEPL